MLEAIGVSPARTLFTANIVIWVEGPTELIFFRKWIKPRLSEKNILEGFHYTFMQYGGSLISHLEAVNDSDFESMFDLLSLCRHPIILIDSDLDHGPNGQSPDVFLKAGAHRLLKEITLLNEERDNSSLFRWTEGKEIENFLPLRAISYAVSSVWSEFKKHETTLDLDKLALDPYRRYYDVLADHFVARGVADQNPKDANGLLAKGRSVWGKANKVEFMRAALETPNFIESELQCNCSSLLNDIEEFITSKVL
jgi:hypothetical protein